MSKITPEQLKVSTGTTDNSTVTTKGYVDEHEQNAIWKLVGTEVALTTTSNTFNPAVPLKYTSDPTITLDAQFATKKYVDEHLTNAIWTKTATEVALTTPTDTLDPAAPLKYTTEPTLSLDAELATKGYVDKGTRTAFVARMAPADPAQTDVTGGSPSGPLYKIEFPTADKNIGNRYNPATSQFTTNVDGLYLFWYSVNFGGVTGSHNYFRVLINASTSTPQVTWKSASDLVVFGDRLSDSNCALLYIASGFPVEIIVQFSGGSQTIDILENSYFCGTLLQEF